MINRPTLFLELILKKKKHKTTGNIIFSKNGITVQKCTEKLFIIDIIDFSVLKPVLKGKGFISELYFKNKKKIADALNFIGCKSFITYESSPLTRATVDYISPTTKVFDGVDNFCKHESYAQLKNELNQEYIKIINSYDKVFFNSEDSLNYFNANDKEHVKFVANGVDYKRFQQKLTAPSLFNNSRSLSRKIAVYAGKIQSMFDTDLVRQLAIANSDVDFFFLGKILEGTPDVELAQISNVKFVGDVHYDLLPAFITNADVCIIPYRIEKQHGGDPIKFYEYYASGCPIVSTHIGDIHKYHDDNFVFIVEKENFLDSFKKARSINDVKETRNIPEHMSWQYKANLMFNLL